MAGHAHRKSQDEAISETARKARIAGIGPDDTAGPSAGGSVGAEWSIDAGTLIGGAGNVTPAATVLPITNTYTDDSYIDGDSHGYSNQMFPNEVGWWAWYLNLTFENRTGGSDLTGMKGRVQVGSNILQLITFDGSYPTGSGNVHFAAGTAFQRFTDILSPVDLRFYYLATPSAGAGVKTTGGTIRMAKL